MHKHQAVLLEQSIEGLAVKEDGIYIDGTFGRGGHARAILEKLSDKGRLIAIDKDPEALKHAETRFAGDQRFRIYHASFADLAKVAEKAGVYGKVDGILLDLGVSSPQLDDPERGFSFIQDGPLDMRMDNTQSMDAAVFVNTAKAEEMACVFKEYGEERFARRIANAIVEHRALKPFERTLELAEVVKQANPKWEKHKHPATRVFQAIRIYINRELNDLKACLQQSLEVMAVNGRLAVISFHSLEDRIVKQFMRNTEQGEQTPIGVPIRYAEIKRPFQRLGKAIKPDSCEIEENIRSRSAVLRIGEKLL